MYKKLQTNFLKKSILFFLIFICFRMSISQSLLHKKNLFQEKFLDTLKKDTLKKPIKIQKKDSLVKIKTDSNFFKNDAIDAIITHKASGEKSYIKQDFSAQKVTLYDKAELNYKDVNIKSGKIIIDYKNELIYAEGIFDSVKKYTQRPIFKQGSESSTQDSIIYNYRTQKAIIYGTESLQGELFTKGEKIKKVNDSTIFVRNIKFTTSKKKNPDYYLFTSKAKIVPNKKIIVGPTHLVVADVPTPAFVPFGYFPLTKNKTSGIILPVYGDSNEQGFFLQNGGYYFAGNDYFDLTLLGDIYTNSSWGASIQSTYRVRYKFSGNFNFRYENLIYGVKGFEKYSKRNNFNLQWTHTQDPKSNPNSRISASVNLGSSSYYRESLNQLNTSQALNNTMNSSISYFKNFVGTPFNMSISANHSQNTNTRSMTLALPNLQVNMNRIFPFAKKSGGKKNMFQKIGFNYSTSANNNYNIKEEDFLTEKMLKKSQSGMKHNASLSTNAKAFKYFSISPSISYNEVWMLKRLKKKYDPQKKEIINDTIHQFTSFREFSARTSFSTNIYGMYKFKNSKLKAIRHVLRPSISFNYKPDFEFFYEKVQKSDNAKDFETYSPFVLGTYGSPSRGMSGTIGLNLSNNIEAKIQKENAKGEAIDKKITLINNLGISTSYNIAADSLQMSMVSVNAGTQLFNNRLSVNTSMTFDPYAEDASGRRYDKFNIAAGGGLMRFMNMNLTLSYNLSNKDFEKKSTQKNIQRNNNPVANTQNTDMFGGRFNNPRNNFQNENSTQNTTFYKNKIPWNMRFSYGATYNNQGGKGDFTNSSLMFSGDISLSKKWKMGGSSGYDFRAGDFTFTQFTFSRDLDSWHMNFNWVPFGFRTSYYFFIGVKAPVLRDLKWEKRNVPDRNLF